jgi:hypothetical protein
VNEAAGTLERVTSSATTTVASNLNQPSSVAWSAINRLYVAQSGNGTIEQVNPSTGALSLLANGLNDVSSITPDPYGGLFALEPTLGRLISVSAQGKVNLVLGGLVNPTSVVQDAYGYLDVTLGGTTASNGQLWRIEPGNRAYVLLKGLRHPSDAAADSNGDVFFIERGAQQVWEDRGLLGAQIVWLGTNATSVPSSILVSHGGDVLVFPESSHRIIHLIRSSTYNPI